MSEYIVDIPESYPFKIVQDGWHYHVECEYQQREKIVRCRDCTYYNDYLGSCMRRLYPYGTTPDGFCAWGERKCSPPDTCHGCKEIPNCPQWERWVERGD